MCAVTSQNKMDTREERRNTNRWEEEMELRGRGEQHKHSLAGGKNIQINNQNTLKKSFLNKRKPIRKKNCVGGASKVYKVMNKQQILFLFLVTKSGGRSKNIF